MTTPALSAAAAGLTVAAAATWWLCDAYHPPLGWTWLGYGLAISAGAAALFGARATASVTLVAGALAIGGLAGVGGYALAAPAMRVERPDPNRELAARVLRLGQTLERHGTRDHRQVGELAFPRNDELPAFLQRLSRPDALLRSPWGGAAQRTLTPPDAPLPTAAQHATGAPLPPLSTPLGPGRSPGDAPFTARTYGALVYDHDPKTDTFVLYGIGEHRGKAVVVAAVDGAP